MTLAEKYPENIPWDLTANNQAKHKSIQWMLCKSDIVLYSQGVV